MNSNEIEIEGSDGELKRLGFVRTIAINAVVCLLNLYESAKQNSGPLKSTVGTVESAVTAVVGPVYEKFKGVPGDVIVFIDNKVDVAANKFDKHAPSLAKQAVNQVQCMAQKASQVNQDMVNEALVGGPSAAIHHAGALYKQSVLSLLAKVWYKVNQVKPLHSVAQMAVPTAAHLSEKYNEAIEKMAAKGYIGFSHFPLVPIEEMTKAYKQVEAAKKGDTGESKTEVD